MNSMLKTDLRRRSSCCRGQQPRHRWAATHRTHCSRGQGSLQPWKYVHHLDFCTTCLSNISELTLERTNTENLKQIFPEKELGGYSPISTFMCLWAIYIFTRWICLFCCRKYVDRTLRIHKSLTDPWMWKLGPTPRNSQKRNTKWDCRWSAVTSGIASQRKRK